MQLAVACDLRVAAPGARMAIPGGQARRAPQRRATSGGSRCSSARAPRATSCSPAARSTPTRRCGSASSQRLGDDALRDALARRRRHRGVGAADRAGPQAGAQPRRGGAVARGRRRCGEIAALEAAAFASDDLQEGMAAFAEKRTARASRAAEPLRQYPAGARAPGTRRTGTAPRGTARRRPPRERVPPAAERPPPQQRRRPRRRSPTATDGAMLLAWPFNAVDELRRSAAASIFAPLMRVGGLRGLLLSSRQQLAP